MPVLPIYHSCGMSQLGILSDTDSSKFFLLNDLFDSIDNQVIIDFINKPVFVTLCNTSY